MNEIICPHCSKAFKVDEAGYADLLKQVRDKEFDAKLHERLELAAKEKDSEVALARQQERESLRSEVEKRNSEIQKLKSELDAEGVARKLAVTEALSEARQERDQLAATLAQLRQEKDSDQKLADAKLAALTERQQHAIAEATSSIEKERDTLATNLEQAKLEKQLSENALRDRYEMQIRDRDEAIERLRDMKAKLSTKMVGETLEVHCETEFNRIRATAFPNAYFEKDNDARSGSKGDYIFRDSDDSGTEIVSIMFEMKNENDTTATKKKNEDFLKELDKDRNEKDCEFAVLVSLLESDSELYNTGIVDVSHRYPKMYVVRPQFFIPMITLLRNSGMKALQYKRELALVQAQNIDITTFESDLEQFQKAFSKNYDIASRQFQTAVEEIDKSISHMQKTKENLLKSINNIRLANNKAQDVSIKKLTKNNPTMAEKFDALD